MKLYKVISSLLLILMFYSCESKLSHKVEPIQCVPYIADPRVDVVELNTYFQDNRYWSLFKVLCNNPGRCADITSKSFIRYEGKFYDAEGVVKETKTFDVTPTYLGDQLECGLLVVFGPYQHIQYAAVLHSQGKVSPPVYFTIKRPKGAI